MRKLLLSLMLAMALAIGSAATAVAAPPPYTDTVVGIETALPTGNISTFAGYASGDLPGLWTASVVHGTLPPDGPGNIIPGSSFALFSRLGVVSGSFASKEKAITLQHGACTQTFHVEDSLSHVGLNGTGTGTGYFKATLTHYGYMFGTKCTLFFATIHGSVSLTF